MKYAAEWEDMSEYLVHFTKEHEGRSAYMNMLGILSSRRIEAGPKGFGIGSLAPPAVSQRAVCFSEIPLHLLTRLADRRGDFGIVLSKHLVIAGGGGPVWYLEKDSPPRAYVEAMMKSALLSSTPDAEPIWKLTPLIDAPGVYPTSRGPRPYRFEWEREWRIPGSHLSFNETEVAALIIPEDLHEAARGFFSDAVSDNAGPGYFCPYIDPRWDRAKVRAALESAGKA